MVEQLEFYVKSIQHELERLDSRFTGNISFQLNFKEGSVGNMNVDLGKSVRMPSERGNNA